MYTLYSLLRSVSQLIVPPQEDTMVTEVGGTSDNHLQYFRFVVGYSNKVGL